MRPKQRETSKSDDLFRARLDQIINPRHELVRLAAEIDWAWIDGPIAPLYSEHGRPAVPTRFMIGLLRSSTSTRYRTKKCASVGSTTRTSSSLLARSSSSTPSRTSARG